jgi:predicted Zn-dependent protease
MTDDVEKLHNDAAAHRAAGRIAEAQAALRRLIDLSPKDAQALSSLGLLLTQNGRGGEAVEFLQRAMRIAPSADLCLNLATTHRSVGDMSAAITVLRDGIDRWPNLANLHTELAGNTHASRVGVSLLNAAGLGQLVASSAEQYIQIAIKWVNNLPALEQLRRDLRRRLLASPLCDGQLFTRNFETALRDVWRQWCHEHRT